MTITPSQAQLKGQKGALLALRALLSKIEGKVNILTKVRCVTSETIELLKGQLAQWATEKILEEKKVSVFVMGQSHTKSSWYVYCLCTYSTIQSLWL